MHPTDQAVNDYVDGGLGALERAELERHLAACDECRQLVDDLREITRRAAALGPIAPPARVWTRIEEAIPPRSFLTGRGFPPRSFLTGRGFPPRSSRPGRARKAWTWLAAAAVVLLCTIVGLRLLRPGRPGGRPGGSAAADNREVALTVESELLQAQEHYQKAISGLEQIASAEKGALDPQTAATLQENLAKIDDMINESRAALKAQPDSDPAGQSLLDGFKAKIALLEDTIALINDMRKGDDAGTARIISGLKRKS
jgi:anti-sigma factor RsiW